MRVTKRDCIPGYEITEDLGVVPGSATLGSIFYKDWFRAIRNLFGGKSKTDHGLLGKAMTLAYDDIVRNAQQAGADAVVRLEIHPAPTQDGMTSVIATGTAVKLAKTDKTPR